MSGKCLKLYFNFESIIILKLLFFDENSGTLLRHAKVLLASGTGRAVAAGGDVNSMVNSIKTGRPQDSEDYLRAEYQFYYLMNTLPIPSVTLMPQICMGGGLGFCHSTTIRIASEKTRLGKGYRSQILETPADSSIIDNFDQGPVHTKMKVVSKTSAGYIDFDDLTFV